MGLGGYSSVPLTAGESPEVGDEERLLTDRIEENDKLDGLGVSMGGVTTS